LLSLAGFKATNPFDFLSLTQGMNAFAAACAFAFSKAFLLHATSTAEPMVGLFWSIASIAVVVSGLATSSQLRLVIGGALLFLAMATYESIVLIGPAELLLICCWEDHSAVRNRNRALWFLFGCGIGGFIGYILRLRVARLRPCTSALATTNAPIDPSVRPIFCPRAMITPKSRRPADRC
jgi:hypothetical protein